jgi:hypothetical protein
MLKTTVRNLISMTLPLTLAVGCMLSRPETPGVDHAVGAAFTEPFAQVGTGEASGPGIVMPSVPAPAGASPEDWALGERVRELLTSDRTLAPYPSEVQTIVDQKSKGLVRLRGTIINPQERRRLRDRIAQVPGVTQVDDQLTVAAPHPQGVADTRAPLDLK